MDSGELKILGWVLLAISAIFSTGLIKKILTSVVSFISGEAKKLSHLASLILGMIVSVLFLISVQANVIPFPDSLQPAVSHLSKFLFTFLTKALYDLYNDLKNKGKSVTKPV